MTNFFPFEQEHKPEFEGEYHIEHNNLYIADSTGLWIRIKNIDPNDDRYAGEA